MVNCIFTAYCVDPLCDKSCPKLVETTYLLERNGLSFDNAVFHAKSSDIDETIKRLNAAYGKTKIIKAENTVSAADLVTYCAICQNWQGSNLHCTVYNLKYSKYLDELKKSWSSHSESEDLTYMKIWSDTSKVLVVSNLDYVKFGDFESQTLLNIVQSRSSTAKTTIIVTPPINNLVGSGSFFQRLQNILKEANRS